MIATRVPTEYQGMWRRTLFAQGGVVDTSTLVLVIQTAQFHADIRIPANRPDFSTVQSLAECSQAQLDWLATQQGFTGITHIENHISQWLRDFDYQPFNGHRDIGAIQFIAEDEIEEIGIDIAYREVWKKIPATHLNLTVQHVAGENRHGVLCPARLFTAGDYFAYVRPRTWALPHAENLLIAMAQAQPQQDRLLDWFDFEISFGEKLDAYRGKVLHSTLPFKEQSIITF